MRELFDVRLNRGRQADDGRGCAGRGCRSADVLVPTVTDRIDAALLAQAGQRLKLIANFGTGTDNIDVDAARAARHHGHQHARAS